MFLAMHHIPTHRFQTEILLKDFKVFVGYRCSLDPPPAEVGVAWKTKFEIIPLR